jgi:hypothetical protein
MPKSISQVGDNRPNSDSTVGGVLAPFDRHRSLLDLRVFSKRGHPQIQKEPITGSVRNRMEPPFILAFNPMTVLAPGRLSTKTCWPKSLLISSATTRADRPALRLRMELRGGSAASDRSAPPPLLPLKDRRQTPRDVQGRSSSRSPIPKIAFLFGPSPFGGLIAEGPIVAASQFRVNYPPLVPRCVACRNAAMRLLSE